MEASAENREMEEYECMPDHIQGETWKGKQHAMGMLFFTGDREVNMLMGSY